AQPAWSAGSTPSGKPSSNPAATASGSATANVDQVSAWYASATVRITSSRRRGWPSTTWSSRPVSPEAVSAYRGSRPQTTIAVAAVIAATPVSGSPRPPSSSGSVASTVPASAPHNAGSRPRPTPKPIPIAIQATAAVQQSQPSGRTGSANGAQPLIRAPAGTAAPSSAAVIAWAPQRGLLRPSSTAITASTP